MKIQGTDGLGNVTEHDYGPMTERIREAEKALWEQNKDRPASSPEEAYINGGSEATKKFYYRLFNGIYNIGLEDAAEMIRAVARGKNCPLTKSEQCVVRRLARKILSMREPE